MLVIEDLVTDGLHIDRFTVQSGETWCMIGGLGSGIEQFAGIIDGEKNRLHAATLQLPEKIGLLSFKRQQAVFEDELRKDDTDHLDRLDPGTPARLFLADVDQHRELIDRFAMTELLDRGYRQLSTGQVRKLLLLHHITRGSDLLVLEHPYDGLDRSSCQDVDQVLSGLHGQGLTMLLLVSNTGDIPSWCTHLAVFKDGRLALQGLRSDVFPEVVELLRGQSSLSQVAVDDLRQEAQVVDRSKADIPLIQLRNGFAHYGEIEVFSGLDLTVKQGDHTLITGPNGCGKSTLLQLIIGDHPLCYRNDLTLFGRRRGSGESIWDLKQQMGIVSADLHRNHRVSGSALAIIVSGLFDSIGLYTKPSAAQQRLGYRWLERLGLVERAAVPFRQLSFGEQRLILLGRALIKAPPLLILDEPTHGLDENHRMALLDFLERIADEQLATIIYVSHRPDEYRNFFKQRVQFH